MKKIGGINFKKKITDLRAAKMSAMRAVATNSVNFFKVDVFEAQGFIDTSVTRWAKRKPAVGGKAAAREGRKILVDTGAGRQSIHAAQITQDHVEIRAEADYMKYHNTGTKNLPQRKFLGSSARLDKQNLAIIKSKLKAVL